MLATLFSHAVCPDLSRCRETAAIASGDVLVVTHAGVIRVLLCRALGMPLENLFRLDVALCGLTILRWDDGKPRLLHFNLRAKTEDQARRA